MSRESKLNDQIFSTPKGKMTVRYGDGELPLGYSLKLLKSIQEMNPGGMGVAAYVSSVQIIDEDRGIDREQKISMNRPLTYGKFTLYQSGSFELAEGRKVAALGVTYDPGRFLKYFGSLLICAGIALRYSTNFRLYKKLQQPLLQDIHA
jgi:hypothetical protein